MSRAGKASGMPGFYLTNKSGLKLVTLTCAVLFLPPGLIKTACMDGDPAVALESVFSFLTSLAEQTRNSVKN